MQVSSVYINELDVYESEKGNGRKEIIKSEQNSWK